MRVGAGLTRGEFAHLTGSGSTGRTWDGKRLFEAEFLFHGGDRMPKPALHEWSILDSFRNLFRRPVAPVRPHTRE